MEIANLKHDRGGPTTSNNLQHTDVAVLVQDTDKWSVPRAPRSLRPRS
jgi:hypothetical protein